MILVIRAIAGLLMLYVVIVVIVIAILVTFLSLSFLYPCIILVIGCIWLAVIVYVKCGNWEVLVVAIIEVFRCILY